MTENDKTYSISLKIIVVFILLIHKTYQSELQKIICANNYDCKFSTFFSSHSFYFYCNKKMEKDEKGFHMKMFKNALFVIILLLCIYIILLSWISMRTGVNIIILFIVGCIPFFGQLMMLIFLVWAIFKPIKSKKSKSRLSRTPKMIKPQYYYS